MKYMGSKARIAKHIHAKIAPTLNNSGVYVEPFCGGMNMTSYVSRNWSGEIIVSDSHEYLIAMWSALQNGWTPPDHVTREQYYEIKANKDADKKLTGWVGFNCSYAGKWFDGYAGITETKNGIRDYQEEAFRNVMQQVDSLRQVDIVHSSYEEMVIPDGAVVYCDPPYSGARKYRDTFDSEKFWCWVRELSGRCHVFVSEYNAPDDFVKIWEKELTSSISANHQSGTTTKSVEALFVHESSAGSMI